MRRRPPRQQPATGATRAMNQREKEEYLREYAILKAQGKPFFPYAVAKDAAMACVVMAVIITMSLVLGAELGSKANPTTTTYVPRPEWYFFFLFEVLRVIKPPSLVPLATIGVPTIGMILLFLLPFYDRGPERRPERRPIATVTGIFVIGAMAFLTYQGANAGSPTAIEMATPTAVVQAGGSTLAEYEAGKTVVAQSGCLACHKIGDNGNDGPGPGPDAHRRRACPRQGDRAHAREPDRADAVVQEPAAAEVQRGRQLPVAAEVASVHARSASVGRAVQASSRARPRDPRRVARTAARRPGARDVRPHRRRLRPDEHRDDGRPAPPLARARGRAARASARAAACSTSPPAPAIWRSSSRAASLPAARWSAATSPRGCSRAPARRREPLEARRVRPRFEWADALAAALRGRPASTPPRSASARATSPTSRAVWRRWRASCAPAGAWWCSRSPPPRGRRCRSSTALWFDRVVPALGRLAGAVATSVSRASRSARTVGDRRRLHLPARTRSSAFPAPARAGGGDGAGGPVRDRLPAHRRRHRRDPRRHGPRGAGMMSTVLGSTVAEQPRGGRGRARGDHAPRRRGAARAHGPHRAPPGARDRAGGRAARLATPTRRSRPAASGCARCSSCSPPSRRAARRAPRRARSASCARPSRSSSCTRRRSSTTI